MTPQEAIKALISNGWNQTAIAAKAGCTQGTVSNIARGSNNPSHALALTIINLAYKHGKLRKSAKEKRA